MHKALIIGAGNIGRGFLAEILTESGFEITFCDVNEGILSAISKRGEYDIIYAGTEQKVTIKRFKTVNSANQQKEYEQAVADSDLIMTAIGVNLLPKISKQLAEAINKSPKKRVLMACENAIRASSQWKAEMDKYLSEESKSCSNFVDVAVDRIVPNIRHENGNVSVEKYRELVADQNISQTGISLNGIKIASKGLDSYISRKLFCVNATHAYIAWLAIKKGQVFIHEALKDPEIKKAAQNLLGELTAVLVSKYDLEQSETASYCNEVVKRFTNEALQDTAERVGRGVLRKLGENDRFITPLKIAMSANLKHTELLKAIKTATEVEIPNDQESKQLQDDIKKLGLAKALFKHTKLPESITEKI